MKHSIIIGLILGVAATTQAQADESNPTGLYFGGNLGADFFEDNGDDEFGGGASFGLQLGYRFSENFRTEVEFGGSVVDEENVNDELVAARFTVNGFYDFRDTDAFYAPYVGGGLGIAAVGFDDNGGQIEGEFTWHAEAGVSLNVNPYLAIVPSYRYTWVDDEEGVTDDNLASHSVRIGARLSF